MTRLAIRGEYSPDWNAIGDRVRAEAGHRCIRCAHPFKAYAPSIALPCDDRCDRRRGLLRINDRSIYGEAAVREPSFLPVHDWARPGAFALTVHHLDGDKGNNLWWNLLSLCNSCHLTIQAKVMPDRLFMFPHSKWFLPYVCGFYAWQVGVDIDRATAIAEREKWLRIGQPWLYSDDESVALIHTPTMTIL